jgi:hypothetical protein
MRAWMLLLAGLLVFSAAGCGPDEETGCTGDEDEDVDADGDGYCAPVDCEDDNPDINPGKEEVCNEIDDNCNGGLDEEELSDEDGDGVVTCVDCDDFNGDLFPGNEEICNGIDDDCDLELGPGEGDQDGDGHLACAECDDTNATVNPGAVEIECDFLDNNCNDELHPDEVDGDGDGTTACDGDCEPDNPDIGPKVDEACNGIDDDCDELVPDNEADLDNDGVSECEGDCDEGNAVIYPGAAEICDGVDNDCDGVFFEAADGTTELTDEDVDGWAPCEDDCNDANPNINPGAFDVLNSSGDNNCDGIAGGLSPGFVVHNANYDSMVQSAANNCFVHNSNTTHADFEQGPDGAPVAVSQGGANFSGTFGAATFGYVFEDEENGFSGIDGSDFFARPESGVEMVRIDFDEPQSYVVLNIGGFDNNQHDVYVVTLLWNDLPLTAGEQYFANQSAETWTPRALQSLNNVGFDAITIATANPPSPLYFDDLYYCH